MPAPITLLTDFGTDSFYVAAMKGAILSINPQTAIVDLTHSVTPQNVTQAAYLLDWTTSTFPAGTIHIAVVDPGVGTGRDILLVEADGQYYLAPDNGLLSLIIARSDSVTIRKLDQPQYWREDISSTFHGRDIFAPTAAHLSLGVPPEQLATTLIPPDSIIKLPLPAIKRTPNSITGQVIFIDSFGNAITNIRRDDLPTEIDLTKLTVTWQNEKQSGDQTHSITGLVRTYHDANPGTPVALFGSSGHLEIAVVDGSGGSNLGIATGCVVYVGDVQRTANSA
ncbi:MAG: SAM-dependent chlorinase/fluorinase [Planctomycetota bacterium]|nr:SAM-dependent chlorinase/fluorinase [Planctomycetota bacterium]